MKKLLFITALALLAATSHAKIYKWVDENGSVHFSDKPYSQDAKEINIQGTGISIQKSEEEREADKNRRESLRQDKTESKTAQGLNPVVKSKEQEGAKVISEADYRISSSVGKLGADMISISGRISSGPRCNDMTVSATATNDNGLKAAITDNVSKSNSFGSTIFEGNTKVSGSAEDYGFWKVDSVTVRCNDVR